MTAITAELGRSVSTVSRDIIRNSGVNGYRAVRADWLEVARTARPRAGKLADDPVLRGYVEDKLACRWSPQQIAERMCLDFPADPGMRLSYDTISRRCPCGPRPCLRGSSPRGCGPGEYAPASAASRQGPAGAGSHSRR